MNTSMTEIEFNQLKTKTLSDLTGEERINNKLVKTIFSLDEIVVNKNNLKILNKWELETGFIKLKLAKEGRNKHLLYAALMSNEEFMLTMAKEDNKYASVYTTIMSSEELMLTYLRDFFGEDFTNSSTKALYKELKKIINMTKKEYEELSIEKMVYKLVKEKGKIDAILFCKEIILDKERQINEMPVYNMNQVPELQNEIIVWDTIINKIEEVAMQPLTN